MDKDFYPRLAVRNIGKNAQVYVPYLLAGVFTVATFYIMNALSQNENLLELRRGGETLKQVLSIGMYIIGILSVMVLFYTNGFLMKGRLKELGLYHILGMNKRNMAQMMAWEAAIVAFGTIIVGLFTGVLLSKLMYLILLRIVDFEIPFQMGISGGSLLVASVLFFLTYGAILVYNLSKISDLNPIDLLRRAEKGEKEPKSKYLLGVLGCVCLGIGYFISLTNEFSVDVLGTFFLAVLLVIIGTYCLFTAGITLVLKFLRKRKNIYYHPRYYTVISGMLYRIKHHAAGLDSICILSTMVLMTLSVTTSLYLGHEDVVRQRFPYEFQLTSPTLTGEGWLQVHEILEDQFESFGYEPENFINFTSGRSWIARNDKEIHFVSAFSAEEQDELLATGWEQTDMFFIDVATYNMLTHQNISLEEDEVLVYGWGSDQLTIAGQEFKIIEELNDFPDIAHIRLGLNLVVPNMNVITDMESTVFDETSFASYYNFRSSSSI